ncbi:M42 family metallopeptidase [Chloroflexia bacterium SDU3-3]|nr:M42 family metallopeptidase [Chloroflexia bacterium SDU3-3]
MDETLTLFKELTEAPGPSGFEAPVRQILRAYLEPYGEIVTDNLGSIVVRKVGEADGPKILLTGHLDEIGFMVTRITEEGYLKFQTLGGWWDQVMLAQRVEVITRNGTIAGVIGSKPPHILSPEERNKVFERKHMFIDIGASSKAEAEAWGITPGDPVVPVCPFTVMQNPDMLLAKAWDNRFGCAIAVEVLRKLQGQSHPNVVYAGATVQEEVGLRGATTLASLIQPDIGFAVDTGIAGDTPGVGPDDVQGKLGAGPVALIFDGSMIPHVGLRNLVFDTAKAEGIPLQFDKMAGGGTDAGKFHLTGAGIPSLVLGVAVRYIHTHASILHRGDFDQLVNLIVAVIKRLDADTVRKLTA